MNQSEALSLILSLANGVDPESGEVFPADSAYQRAQTLRALYAAAEALDKAERFKRRKQQSNNITICTIQVFLEKPSINPS